MRVGIIGYGVVGSAVAKGLKKMGNKVFVNDINHKKVKEDGFKPLSKEEILDKVDYIILTVPTPTVNFKIDLSILNRVIEELYNIAKNKYYKKTIIIKSTVVPGTTEKYQKKYGDVFDFCFSPEFLREKSPLRDFLNPDRLIFSGKNRRKVAKLYKQWKCEKIFLSSTTEAEMIKYASNCFLATKVAYGNEIYNLCKILKINPKRVISAVIKDHRINKSHLNPNHPGFGKPFGGSCLPKDLEALIGKCISLGYDPHILWGVYNRNKEDKMARR